jgi:hypothetical protein
LRDADRIADLDDAEGIIALGVFACQMIQRVPAVEAALPRLQAEILLEDLQDCVRRFAELPPALDDIDEFPEEPRGSGSVARSAAAAVAPAPPRGRSQTSASARRYSVSWSRRPRWSASRSGALSPGAVQRAAKMVATAIRTRTICAILRRPASM